MQQTLEFEIKIPINSGRDSFVLLDASRSSPYSLHNFRRYYMLYQWAGRLELRLDYQLGIAKATRLTLTNETGGFLLEKRGKRHTILLISSPKIRKTKHSLDSQRPWL